MPIHINFFAHLEAESTGRPVLAMSSFFTTPASQRKRKRPDSGPSATSKMRVTTSSNAPARPSRDESISGSDSESDVDPRRADSDDDDDASSESDHPDETAAERRLYLAERYLENIREQEDDVGFDAEQIDKDLIAERLKEDVAETKGRLYRHVAAELSFDSATQTQFRADTLPTTSIATHPPYVYTVSKDMTLIKWEIPTPPSSKTTPAHPSDPFQSSKRKPRPVARRPTKLIYTKGLTRTADLSTSIGHTSHILAVACSPDGKYVVTGGLDKRLVIWDAATLTPLKAFTQHRDAVVALAFRRDANQLYSASRDRTIKLWSLDELAYVETLFGHQDGVVDVAALTADRCVSVGARDRTARLWKVVEETQLVFRGGRGSSTSRGADLATRAYAEGSIDRVALVDDDTFVTGSDSGALCLWTVHKKKPVFSLPLAHGLDPPLDPAEASAEADPSPAAVPPPQPRWITALAILPYSDLVLSGSWDGCVRAWRVTPDRRRLEPVGVLGRAVYDDEDGVTPSSAQAQPVQGIINDLAVFERGQRGRDGVCVVAAVATEHRLGRWRKVKGKNGAVVFELSKRSFQSSDGDQSDKGNGEEEAVADEIS